MHSFSISPLQAYVAYAPAAFIPRNILVVIDLSDASGKIPSDTTGDRSRDFPTSSAAQRLNHYATAGPQHYYIQFTIKISHLQHCFDPLPVIFRESTSVSCIKRRFCVDK